MAPIEEIFCEIDDFCNCQRRSNFPPFTGVKVHHLRVTKVCPQARTAERPPHGSRSSASLWTNRVLGWFRLGFYGACGCVSIDSFHHSSREYVHDGSAGREVRL